MITICCILLYFENARYACQFLDADHPCILLGTGQKYVNAFVEGWTSVAPRLQQHEHRQPRETGSSGPQLIPVPSRRLADVHQCLPVQTVRQWGVLGRTAQQCKREQLPAGSLQRDQNGAVVFEKNPNVDSLFNPLHFAVSCNDRAFRMESYILR